MRSRIYIVGSVGLAALMLVLFMPREAPSASSSPGTGDRDALVSLREVEAPEEAPVPPAPSIAVSITRESAFAWPALGLLTSYFGEGHPTGIDISLPWDEDAPIFASAAGTVSFAGGNACCSYGLHVVIDHAGGLSSLYGHLSEIAVEEGQEVRQGDLIGLGGNTGASEGKHLHFEVQVDGSTVDPLRFLPSQQEARYGSRTEPMDCQDRAVRADPDSTVRIEFKPSGGEAHLVATAFEAETTGARAPAPEVQEDGPLAVAVRFDSAAAANGQTSRYRLDATIARGDVEELFSCWLDFRTMRTLPNSDATIARYRSRLASPTPVPTATRTPRPAPTPTSIAPRPVSTPGPPQPLQQPTQAPRAPQPIQQPTRTAGR